MSRDWGFGLYVPCASHSVSQSVLTGIKDFVGVCSTCPFHMSLSRTHPAFHPGTALSPQRGGPFSAFVGIFIVLLFYRVFCNSGKGLLCKVRLAPGVTP